MAVAWTVEKARRLRQSAALVSRWSGAAIRLSTDVASAPKAVPPIAAVTSVAEGKREVLNSCVASAITETMAAIPTAFHHAPRRAVGKSKRHEEHDVGDHVAGTI